MTAPEQFLPHAVVSWSTFAEAREPASFVERLLAVAAESRTVSLRLEGCASSDVIREVARALISARRERGVDLLIECELAPPVVASDAYLAREAGVSTVRLALEEGEPCGHDLAVVLQTLVSLSEARIRVEWSLPAAPQIAQLVVERARALCHLPPPRGHDDSSAPELLVRWAKVHHPDLFTWSSGPGFVRIVDRRAVFVASRTEARRDEQVVTLVGAQSELFRACAVEPSHPEHLIRRFSAVASPETLARLLDLFVDQGLLMRVNDALVSLATHRKLVGVG